MDDGIIRKAYKGNGKRPRGRPKGSKNKERKDWLLKPEIRSAVKAAVKDIVMVDASRVINEEARLAFSDIRLLPGCPQDIPDEIAFAVSSFVVEEDVLRSLDSGEQIIRRKTKFTLWPKGDALLRLSRHLGLYERDNRQQPERTGPVINLYLEQGSVQLAIPQPALPDPANGYEDQA